MKSSSIRKSVINLLSNGFKGGDGKNKENGAVKKWLTF